MQYDPAKPNSLIEKMCGQRARSASLPQRMQRVWYVARYYRKAQIARRLMKTIRQSMGRFGGSRWLPTTNAVGRWRTAEELDLSALWLRRCTPRRMERALSRVGPLCDRRFTYLGTERCLGDPIDWRLSTWDDVPQLWRFHLHYHDDLLDLAFAAREAEAGDLLLHEAWEFVTQWIAGNPADDTALRHDAWHPFCISRRVVNWILLWSLAGPPTDKADEIAKSLHAQVNFLASHLELDLRGNHLLENLRALVVAGVFFTGADAQRWLRTAARLFPGELAEQILPSGEHFERSPMYHALMLEAVLDIRDALHALTTGATPSEKAGQRMQADNVATALFELQTLCGTTAERMAYFLEAILHPDGDIPLFGDSALDELIDPRRLIAAVRKVAGKSASASISVADSRAPKTMASAAGSSPRQAACATSAVTIEGWQKHRGEGDDARSLGPARRVGDYWTFRDSNDFLIFDAGRVGADHLPAHAHADLLGIEASVGGRRLLVDSGVYNYEDDMWRCYCRSTLAHNTPMIGDENQCDMWSKFRMGYRGWPGDLATGQTADFHWARAWHDAYRRVGVSRLWRWLACRPTGPWICVDWVERPAAQPLVDQLHLHPEARVEQVDTYRFSVRIGVELTHLVLLGAADASLHELWYCPRFGERRPSPTIRWTAADNRACGWVLLRARPTVPPPCIRLTHDGRQPIVRCATETGEIEMRPAEL